MGAWGIGWQVLLDGLEITQFTYFQQAGGLDLDPISAEITYGLERIGTFIAQVDSIYDLKWSDTVTYRDIRHREEVEFSKYNFEAANVDMLFKLFSLYEEESKRLLDMDLVLPAYDYCLKCSHTFNLLDSRGAISVTERVGIIARVRQLACEVARRYLESREKQGFPLLESRNSGAVRSPPRFWTMEKSELVVELGVEEIPASMLEDAAHQFADILVESLKAQRLVRGEQHRVVYAAPHHCGDQGHPRAPGGFDRDDHRTPQERRL